MKICYFESVISETNFYAAGAGDSIRLASELTIFLSNFGNHCEKVNEEATSTKVQWEKVHPTKQSKYQRPEKTVEERGQVINL